MAKAWIKKVLWVALSLIIAYLVLQFFAHAMSAWALEKQFKVDFHIECWTTLSRAAEIERLLNEVLKEDYPDITIELKMEPE